MGLDVKGDKRASERNAQLPPLPGLWVTGTGGMFLKACLEETSCDS